MLGRQAHSTLWRFIGLRRRPQRLSEPRPRSFIRPEFPAVNRFAGRVPLYPELSGLQLRPVDMSSRLLQAAIDLRYCWHPSAKYRQRQKEMRVLNSTLRHTPRTRTVAPLLTYTDSVEVTPVRLQPMPGRERRRKESHRDLHDLEEAARLDAPHIIAPRIPEIDPRYLLTTRPLVTRRYRALLRPSHLIAATATLYRWVQTGATAVIP